MLRPPRNRGEKSLCARDIALRAKGGQPLAAPASSNYQEGGSSSSIGSALPPPSAPPPLEPSPLEKRGLDQETEMTDATVKQQGEPKRRKEHLEGPQARDSSCSSSSSSISESSTDTEIGVQETVGRQRGASCLWRKLGRVLGDDSLSRDEIIPV